jgi:hypothetical protein
MAGLLPVVIFPDVVVPRSVWVRRDGGSRLDVIRETARLAFNVYDATDPTGKAVEDLAQLVRALIGACPDGRPVLAVSSVTAPMQIDDPNGQPRRYLTADLIVRGSTE